MIARITGELESVEGHTVVVRIPMGEGEVSHEALVGPYHAASLLGQTGRRVSLHTIEFMESANQGASFTPRLLAFQTREDRAFFELLTKVKGLGPRRALRALAAPTREIAGAIAGRDAKALSRLPEIGKKLAEAIIAEIGDKAAAFGAGAGAPTAGPAGGTIVEARSIGGADAERAAAALVRLGETRVEAERMVERALRLEPAPAGADDILAAALAVRGV